MARDNDTVVYGARNTIKLLENGVVKTLLLSEGLALHKLFFKRANGEIFWDIANDGAHQKQLIEKY
jgi:peptide subunit release factor 1 (eRF1)